MTNVAIGNRSRAKILYWNLELNIIMAELKKQRWYTIYREPQLFARVQFIETTSLAIKLYIYNVRAVWELFVQWDLIFLRSPTFCANCVLFAKCLSSEWEQHPWWHELGSARRAGRRWVCTFLRRKVQRFQLGGCHMFLISSVFHLILPRAPGIHSKNVRNKSGAREINLERIARLMNVYK